MHASYLFSSLPMRVLKSKGSNIQIGGRLAYTAAYGPHKDAFVVCTEAMLLVVDAIRGNGNETHSKAFLALGEIRWAEWDV